MAAAGEQRFRATLAAADRGGGRWIEVPFGGRAVRRDAARRNGAAVADVTAGADRKVRCVHILVGIVGGVLVALMLLEIFLAFLLPRRVKRDPLLARRVAIYTVPAVARARADGCPSTRATRCSACTARSACCSTSRCGSRC